MKDTKIQWADHTFNPWRGCQKVHSGCKNCYAETRSNRFGEDFANQRIVLSDAGWKAPLKWNSEAEVAGIRQRVFCASLADVFEEWAGPMLDHHGAQIFYGSEDHAMTMNCARSDLFNLIDSTPNLDWLLLTKRPENVGRMWKNPDVTFPADFEARVGRRNVWIGTSVSNQATAENTLPELLRVRDLSPVLFVSAEPLIDAVDLTPWLGMLDWVIVGGESGPGSRDCRVEWIYDLIDQCASTGVPCFIKQLGSSATHSSATSWAKSALAHVLHAKAGDPVEWPENLRVQQFPLEVTE